MRPFLLRIHIPFLDKILPIHSYGFMLAMAFLTGILLMVRQARQQGEQEDDVYGMAYWVVISAILGSRLFHCIVYWEHYIHEPWRVLYVWEGGLVFYGGLIAASLAPYIYFRKHNLDYWKWADMAAPTIALGLAFGRTGCLLVGCCHGKACSPDFPLAMTFPAETIGRAGVPLYPTQLWSILANLAIFALLYFYFRPRKTFHGQVMAVFIALYGIVRSVIELWRDDPRGFLTLFHLNATPGISGETPGLFGKLVYFEALKEGTAGNYALRLSESQLVSIVMLGIAVGIFFMRRNKGAVENKQGKSAIKKGAKKK